MAIIRPSNKFEGSELNLTVSATPYIREGVRKASFNKNTNQDGAYLYFLPAYKTDSSGNGVWYKKVSVRDNFGVNFKEKYYVPNRAEDPAEYFAGHFRTLYPEEAKVTDAEVNGKKFKKYPVYGRVTDRVLYNVAFAQNLAAGAHVLDLPLRNGADILQSWIDGKDLMGNERPPINDPDRCVAVFVKLKENSANPWVLQVDGNAPVQLPNQLADNDYLYNLDEILVHRSKEEIIAKLREMYSSDVFEDCMDGYVGLTKRAVQGARLPSATPVAQPMVQPVAAPSIEIARPSMEIARPSMEIARPLFEVARPSMATTNIKNSAPSYDTAPPAYVDRQPVNAPGVADIGQLPPNPMASGRLSREDALRFIAQD